MAINTQDILNQLKQGVSQLAKSSFKNRAAQDESAGQAILTLLEDDVKTWTTQLASGQLKVNDFKDLVLDQKDKLESAALTQAGLTEIAADQFKQDVLNLIVNVVTKAI